MMRVALIAAAFSLVLMTQGCCSLFTSSPQTLSINSKPEGAKVQIGQYEGVTPYQLSMPRGKDYVIQATYQGKTKTQTLERKVEPVFWINILFWPGLIVDVVTGDMFKYDPTTYTFDFTSSP